MLPDETLRGVTGFEVLRAGVWVPFATKSPSAQECITDCTFRYTIDLDRVERSYEGVIAVGASTFLAPTSSWIAHPWPMPRGEFAITIDGAAAAPSDAFASVPFSTGLRRKDATHFTLPTNDFAEGSFAAFGKVRHRRVESAGASIDVVIAGEAKLTLTDDEVAAWVREDGEVVGRLYGRFPVSPTSVYVVPIEGATDVVFGKVLSLGGSSIIALTGTDLQKKDLHDDWVLLHEMVHVGFPTMYGVRWLTEGLSTFWEPVMRTRVGWHTRETLWSNFAHAMRRGIPRPGSELALDKRESIDDIYWGGAVFVMMAEVGIRIATSNQKSFEAVMRAVLAKGGDATVVWSMSELIAMAKEVTGTNLFAELVERYGQRGEAIDLAGYLADLGIVTRDGKTTLDETAPHAAIRRSIETGH